MKMDIGQFKKMGLIALLFSSLLVYSVPPLLLKVPVVDNLVYEALVSTPNGTICLKKSPVMALAKNLSSLFSPKEVMASGTGSGGGVCDPCRYGTFNRRCMFGKCNCGIGEQCTPYRCQKDSSCGGCRHNLC